MPTDQSTLIDQLPSWREQSKARKQRTRLLGTQGRLLLAFCAILFAALGIMAYAFVRDTHARLSAQLRNEAMVVASSLASNFDRSVEGTPAERIHSLLTGVKTGENIVLAGFYDREGQPVAFSKNEGKLPAIRPEVLSTYHIYTDAELGKIGLITQPIFGKARGDESTGPLLGYVTVAVALKGVDAGVQFAQQIAAAVACGVVLFALPVTWLLVRSMFGPIREMQLMTQRIMENDLDVEVLVTSRDAVGRLAATFNELVKWVKESRARLALSNAQLEAANKNLEAKIEARTVQLEAANQRLAGEIAEKEDFLRAVSHDLNAPLRNIGGMVSMMLLKNKDLAPDAIQRLDRIKKNVEIESDLINELLELSRIKTRRGKFESVETERMIWELRGLFENDLRTRQIELVLETSLPTLFVEKARIRQVFQNLIDNAIKYMGERPVREIRVGCRLNVTEAEFYVRDTGTGIHPEDVDKVFFIFRRGRSETTQKTQGKGIGLASVKSIIETYSGKIWVESKLNEGTAFFFTINGKYVPSVSGQTIEQLRAAGEQDHEPVSKAA
jgi:signal transduction histidine kinase